MKALVASILLSFSSVAGAQVDQYKYVTVSIGQVTGYTNGQLMNVTETADLSYELYTMPANDTDFADDAQWASEIWAYYCPALPAPCTVQFNVISSRPCVVALVFDPNIDPSQQGSNRWSALSAPICVTFP